MAEREGFEPSVRGLPIHTLSRRALSTAQTSLRKVAILGDMVFLVQIYSEWAIFAFA